MPLTYSGMLAAHLAGVIESMTTDTNTDDHADGRPFAVLGVAVRDEPLVIECSGDAVRLAGDLIPPLPVWAPLLRQLHAHRVLKITIDPGASDEDLGRLCRVLAKAPSGHAGLGGIPGISVVLRPDRSRTGLQSFDD